MPENPPRDVFLEIDPTAQPRAPEPTSAPASPASAIGTYLEPVASPTARNDDEDEGPRTDATRRKKVRAADRVASSSDQVSLALVAALQSERPLLAALWPDLSPAELVRSPPPAEAFTARCDYARRAIDAVGRRDAESRARAEIAQRNLTQHLARLSAQGGEARDEALAELTRAQERDLLDAVKILAGGQKVLYAADVSRLDAAAETRGIDAARGRSLARAEGYELHDAESRLWTPLEALPGAPATMDAAATALLQHPAQGAEAVRSGAVLAWLRANNASPDVVSKARDARMAAERGGAESLAVHAQVWALGRRDLIAGRQWLRAPGEIAPAVRAATLTLDDLARAAKDGVLGAWLRMQGWVAAAGASDLVARGEPSGMKRLAWALGEPFVVGDQGFTDPSTLARGVMSRPDLRETLTGLYASGDLLAWLESLPPAQRDEVWIDRLRRAAGEGARAIDPLALWLGVYAHARVGTLSVHDASGNLVVLGSVEQLTITTQVAEMWDALKRVYRTGELLAWLAMVAPDRELPAVPRPPRDEDAELNAVLWSLGHKGLVLEWGPRDFGVSSPGDLVRAYQTSWQQLESQLARGYVFDWVTRFHGGAAVVQGDGRERAATVRDVVAALRGEVGRLPGGYLALKLALLSGLRYLPLDPCAPGDAATFRGYQGVTQQPSVDPRGWEPLRDHARHGSAILWLAMSPGVRPQLARSMVQSAFRAPDAPPEDAAHHQRVMAAMPRTFGDPIPSPALQAEFAGASRAPQGSVRGAPTAPAVTPTRPSRAGRWVTLALVVAAGAGGTWWWSQQQDVVPEVIAQPGSEVWVELRVALTASRTNLGRSWDLDGSDPDLQVSVRTRDESVRVGPCENSRECSARFDSVRLVPGVPFRVTVHEMDWVIPHLIGGQSVRWQGRTNEVIRTTIGATTVEITVRRVGFQPGPVVVPVAVPTKTVTDAGARARTAVDAGATRRRTSTRRTQSPQPTNPSLIPPVVFETAPQGAF